MSGPQAVNPIAETGNSLIQSAIVNLAAKMAIAELDTAFPELNLPILKTLSDDAVYALAKMISKKLQLFATFTIIDIQIGSETNDYEKAEQELRTACQSGDPKRIITASGAYDQALARLVHYDGSASPK